jgi:hypothetical protein
MELELVLADEIHPVRGHRRNSRFAGKGIALGHPVAGGHLDKEILYADALERFEELEVVRQDNETAPVFFEDSKELKIPVTVASRDYLGKIGVPLRVFDQKNGAPFIGYELTPHDGPDSCFFGSLDEKNQSIKAVGVGQCQPVHTVFFGSLTELFDGSDSPALGIVGMDIEMNESIHIHQGTEIRFFCPIARYRSGKIASVWGS